MREAVHCIGTLLILTGCMGNIWMGFQLVQSVGQTLHALGNPAGSWVAQSERQPERAPFILMPP